MDILADLEFRCMTYQITDIEALGKRLSAGAVKLYAGFDPTADSLHIGSLLPILALRRFQLAGHIPIALVGGGTGLIGDPSGKEAERKLNTGEVVEQWSTKIRQQLEKFLDFKCKKNPALLVSNYDWLENFNVIPFLRDIGKHFPLGYMLGKESVRSRVEAGISFTEFSYMVLQSYDFMVLARDHGCSLQIGGSDQWGNITAGIDLIRRTLQKEAYGLTLPLVTKADGSKFGKTESETIWLDAKKTSPYQFYQFWVNSDDKDVIGFLKYFTFLSHDEINDLEREQSEHPEKREAHKKLAEEVTTLVHDKKATARAEKISRALFYGDVKKLSNSEIEEGFKDVPSATIKEKEISLIDLLVKAGVSSSKRQAREDIKNGAIYINDERNKDLGKTITLENFLDGKYLILRRGKKKYHLVKHES